MQNKNSKDYKERGIFMIKVELKDGSIIEVEEGKSILDVAKQISQGLARMAMVGKVDGKVKDLRFELNKDCKLEILTFDSIEGKKAYWHTTSHIMAQAVMRLFPDTKFAIGPAIDEGFYYDFDSSATFNDEDKEKIEALKCVKGTFIQAGQFQVIIGNTVTDFYNDFVKVSGIEGVSKDSVKDAAKSNMSFIQKLMANLAEIFSPLIPAIIVGGLILGFRNIIGDVKFFEDGTKTLIEISQFWAGTYSFLWLIGEAIFHFLPVGIVWAITKKMGTTQILGIVLGITLVSPQLLNAYAVSGGADIPFWDFGFAKVNMIGYQAQVIPAILAGFVLVYLEKFFRKISPAAISMIIVPFFALVPSVLIAHTVLGPIGWKIGDMISTVVYSGLTSSFSWLFAGIFGFVYAPLVITGLHHMTNAIDLQLMSQVGGTLLWPMIALSNIAQGSAVLAMIYLQRKNEEKV